MIILTPQNSLLPHQIIPAHELDALRATIITEIEAPYRSRLETLIKTTDTLRKNVQEKENAVHFLKSQLDDREQVWRRAMESLHHEYKGRLERERSDKKELQDMVRLQLTHLDYNLNPLHIDTICLFSLISYYFPP